MMKRHPLEVTSDRLADHMDKYADEFDGAARDDISHIRFLLEQIAEKHAGPRPW